MMSHSYETWKMYMVFHTYNYTSLRRKKEKIIATGVLLDGSNKEIALTVTIILSLYWFNCEQ